MKNTTKYFAVLIVVMLSLLVVGCEREQNNTADRMEQAQQERIQKEGAMAVGLPSIKNFRTKRALKDIQELCDQEGLVTYTYIENLNPVVVKGHMALGGKFTYLGETISYPVPYSTQFTNPMKIADKGHQYGYAILPQADPDGLFKPASAEATWVLIKNPNGKDVSPVYMEPKLACFRFKLPMD